MELSAMLDALKALQMEQHYYGHAMMSLSYDGETVAPPASAESRGMTMAFLAEKSHAQMVNERTRELLDHLNARADELDAPTRRQVELLREELEQLTCIPAEEFAEASRLRNEGYMKWREAKQTNNFALFAPVLEKLVEMSLRFAGYRDAKRDPYDVMLDDHEKGMSRATLDPLFALLRKEIVPMLDKVRSQPPLLAFASAPCAIDAQRALAYDLMAMLGVDDARCALGETEHPFTTGSSRYDVRITTHYHENAFLSSMYSVIHESGHALYELGMADEYQFTALTGVSMGMHESQSRFCENLIGHDPRFLRFLAPVLKGRFPTLSGMTDEELIRAANRVEPSLIRTEADQVTYPLHIMLRYELEKQLMSGSLAVRDLPEAWNALSRDYLGLVPPTDAAGVLQDVHWSEGMFGYFPTYALGSAYASQFMHAMRNALDVDALLTSGNLSPIVGWLRDNIHRHAALYTPDELMRRATGEPFDPKYYVEHLHNVMKETYGE